MMTNYQKIQFCVSEARKAQSGAAKDVFALRKRRLELEQIDAMLRKAVHEEAKDELFILKRSLLDPMRLLNEAKEREKELASNPSVGRVKELEESGKKRSEDFESYVQKKYEQREKEVRKVFDQMLIELKEKPAHDDNSLFKWFNEKIPEFSMDDVKVMLTHVKLDELKMISVSSLMFYMRTNLYTTVLQKIANKDAIQKVSQLEKEKEDDAEMAEIRKEEQENGEAIKAWRHAYYCVLEDVVNKVNQIENKIWLKKKEVQEKGQKYHHVSQKVKRDLLVIALYDREFSKNSELLDKPMTEVAKCWKKPTSMVVEQNPVVEQNRVCTHLCSIEDVLSAIIWLSSGLGGMFKKLDPSLFLFLLTSTFELHKCSIPYDVADRLFSQVITSNVRNGGIVGPQADCEAHVCHDRNGCLSCLGVITTITFLKYGPNCITKRDSASSFRKTGLHCSANDGAIKSMLVSMSTLDSYGLFCFILYLCQQMDYFNSNIARDRKVQIDHKKIADVKFLIALLVQHHLPTNPCLSVLVERYKIPTIVENPIPLAEIASFLSARLGITIECASERIMAVKREYFSPENVADRLKSTEERLTSWCRSDAQHMSRHGHGLQEPCPPGCLCCG